MRSIKFKKAPFIAFVCLLPLLLGLGFWQLDRAEQKQQLLMLQQQRQSEEISLLKANSPDSVDDLLYQAVKGKGNFDSSHHILQSNQINDGKVGYFVLTPFLIQNSNKAILVNRGWIPSRVAKLPELNVPENEIEIRGGINRFARPGIVLAGVDKPTESWPVVVQVVNTDEIAKKLGYGLFSYQIELDKSAEFGFKRDWQHAQNMTPEKHIAYAVQWFLLALTLSILFIIYGIEKNNAR